MQFPPRGDVSHDNMERPKELTAVAAVSNAVQCKYAAAILADLARRRREEDSGIAAGAPFVLVSHNVVECMDAALPASLSPAMHEVLRETLGFDGIVITDDLAMDAVKQYANGEAAVLAVLAGNDMLITSDYQNDIPAVLAAVADGRIAEREIDAHVLRILRYKQAQGWIE